MSETYNPQERSFIKKPEIKHCVACGQPLAPDVKAFSAHMNHYIADTEGAVACVINSNEPTIKVGDVVLYKIDPKTKVASFPSKLGVGIPANSPNSPGSPGPSVGQEPKPVVPVTPILTPKK